MTDAKEKFSMKLCISIHCPIFVFLLIRMFRLRLGMPTGEKGDIRRKSFNSETNLIRPATLYHATTPPDATFRRVCDIALAVSGPHNLEVPFGPQPQQICLHGGLLLLRSPHWIFAEGFRDFETMKNRKRCHFCSNILY